MDTQVIVKYMLLLPIMAYSSMASFELNGNVSVFLCLFPLCSWSSINLLYPSMQKEILEKTQTILRVAKMSWITEYSAKAILPFFISIAHVLLGIFALSVYIYTTGMLWLSIPIWSYLVGIVLSSIMSIVVCFAVTRTIKSYKQSIFQGTLLFAVDCAIHIAIGMPM